MPGLHDGATVGDILTSVFRRFPDRIAFRQDGRKLTYRQAEDTLARWVRILGERGLRPGEGVGLLSPNRPEAWLAQVAPALAGGRYTALHPLGSFDDHLQICDEAELRFLFVDPAYGERAVELLEKSGAVESVFTFGPSDAGEDIIELASKAAAPGRLDRGPHGPDDLCWLLYTGGTTGVPKAVMHPERTIAALAYNTSLGWDVPDEIRYLAVGPVSHASGVPIWLTLLHGGTVSLQSRFDPAGWIEAVASERITFALVVPTMIYAILDDPALETTDVSSLEVVLYGASPASPTRIAEGIERLGSIFCGGFGQTESAGQGTALWRSQHDPTDLHRLTSCGSAMPFVRISIRDGDQPVPDGTRGEMCLQGPMVMQGYWKQPELTESALAGGWLHTGDIAMRDEDGLYYIVDREKDMIISGGSNVYPREVEDVLAEHPSVSMSAVIGVPDEKWGEAVKALVVLRQAQEASGEELSALVRDRKGPVYTPKSVEFVDSLPLTPVGKVDKKAIRAPYWEGQDRPIG